MRQKRIAIVNQDCVACGNCVKYCPKQAISIPNGIYASVSETTCVGCGRCEQACPAGVITIVIKEEAYA